MFVEEMSDQFCQTISSHKANYPLFLFCLHLRSVYQVNVHIFIVLTSHVWSKSINPSLIFATGFDNFGRLNWHSLNPPKIVRSSHWMLPKHRVNSVFRSCHWDQCCLTALSVTVGLSAPSAGVPTTPGCVVQSTHCREGIMPSRGILTHLRGADLIKFNKAEHRVLHTAQINPTNEYRMVKNDLGATLRKRTWGYWLTESRM